MAFLHCPFENSEHFPLSENCIVCTDPSMSDCIWGRRSWSCRILVLGLQIGQEWMGTFPASGGQSDPASYKVIGIRLEVPLLILLDGISTDNCTPVLYHRLSIPSYQKIKVG